MRLSIIDISTKYFAKEFSKKNKECSDYNYLISAILIEVVTTDHALMILYYVSIYSNKRTIRINITIAPM